MIIMGFFNFGNDDKKEEAKVVNIPQASVQPESPYTSNGLVLKDVPVEKEIITSYEARNQEAKGYRMGQIAELFGANDLDYILRAYAPDTIDIIDHLLSNQGRNKARMEKQQKSLDRLEEQVKEIHEMLSLLVKEKGLSNNITR